LPQNTWAVPDNLLRLALNSLLESVEHFIRCYLLGRKILLIDIILFSAADKLAEEPLFLGIGRRSGFIGLRVGDNLHLLEQERGSEAKSKLSFMIYRVDWRNRVNKQSSAGEMALDILVEPAGFPPASNSAIDLSSARFKFFICSSTDPASEPDKFNLESRGVAKQMYSGRTAFYLVSI
jgi:hypothetical protein